MGKATLLTLDLNYSKFLQAIKERLRIAQLRVTNNINTEVINFYWQLGKDILYIQSTNTHWGSKFLQHLAHDLQQAHPGMSGFSKRSLEYMRLLASLYPARSFTQQAAAQLPSPQSDLAQEILKNPYSFDFITISKQAQEREIDKELTKYIKDFLLEKQLKLN